MKLFFHFFFFVVGFARNPKILTYDINSDGSCPGVSDQVSFGPTKCYRVIEAGEVQAAGSLSVDEDSVVTVAAMPWGLDRIDQRSLPLDNAPFKPSVTGYGVNIYIIDTGIYTEHTDFQGRAVALANFVKSEPNEDLNGHGTHCAGTAGGFAYGVAQRANLFGIKVLSRYGNGTYYDVIEGVNAAVKHAGDKPSVLSLSLGGPYNEAMNIAIRDAAGKGHIVVIAAGNRRTDACDFSPASAGGRRGAIVTVMSSTMSDALAGLSNYGQCTDMVAPGSSILSCWIGSPQATRVLSGTSMATPHIAGAAAVFLQLGGNKRAVALRKLYNLALKNKITGVPSGSGNLLVQVPRSSFKYICSSR